MSHAKGRFWAHGKLDVSQATLNRRISNLKQILGKKLFNRSTTGCTLLPPGQVLLAHAERVENEMIQTTKKGRLCVRQPTDYSLKLYASCSYLEQSGTRQQLTDLNEHRVVSYVENLIFSSELDYNKQIFRNWKWAIEISGVTG